MAVLFNLIHSRCFLIVRFRCSQYISCNFQTKIKSPAWTSFEKKLVELGLCEKSAQDIASNHAFLPIMENKVNETLDTFLKLQFGGELLEKLIKAHPLLLLVDASTVERNCVKFLSLFTKKYVYTILLLSPEVLNEEWDVTSDKLKYLQDHMCVSNMDIVNNGILKHPLDHIKLRHEFLIKTGKYKKLNPKLSTSERNKLNPSIQDIMNTTSEYFAEKVAGVTKLEFYIYQQLYFECDI